MRKVLTTVSVLLLLLLMVFSLSACMDGLFHNLNSIIGGDKYSKGLQYEPNADNTYSVEGIGDCTDTEIIIPQTFEGRPVTSIGSYAFSWCNSLTSVVISDSVTNIGYGAFSNCDSLTSVVIPDSVTSIGSYAFYWCNSLTSVVIPDSVTSIGDYAFKNCSSLTSITVSENNSAYKSIDGDLYTKDGKTLIQYAIGKTDTSFAIPDGVIQIVGSAFSNCDSLTSVAIPDSVTSIGNDAFAWCDSLTSVVIPDSVTSIGSYAFSWCNSFTSIVIPDSVTSIGYSAFYDCDSLTSISFSDTSTWYVTEDYDNWRNKTGGTEVDVSIDTDNAGYFKDQYSDYYWYKL